jgi:hypothetical protein
MISTLYSSPPQENNEQPCRIHPARNEEVGDVEAEAVEEEEDLEVVVPVATEEKAVVEGDVNQTRRAPQHLRSLS